MKYPQPTSITKEFTDQEVGYISDYVKDQVRWLHDKTQALRETKLPKWIKTYKGIPENETLDFPWPGASNLQITLAATFTDELLSRVMAIYSSEQLFAAQIYGDFGSGEGEQERTALEYFLSDVALEPTELDLYRVEETWFSSAIRYGTGIIHMPWTTVTEQRYSFMPGISIAEGASGKNYNFEPISTCEGPAPENVPLNKFMTDPQVADLSKSKFVIRIDTMHYHDLRKWKNKDIFTFIDEQKLQRVLISPDREGPDYKQMTEEEIKGLLSNSSDKAAQEWDIYECHLKWDHSNGNTYSLICFYHFRSETFLGGIFNMYPENMLPLEDAKLAYDDETYYGYGFMEMLEMYQREISINHNQRIDNKNLSNTGVGRINPQSKLASILKIYPGALFPAAKDEVEPMAFGTPNANFSTDDEQLTMQYAASRAGVDPATGGAGGGTVNPKKGSYSAGGTAIVQQQKDNRNNLRMSDMRSAHSRLGRKAALLYSYFGIDSKAKKYGDQAETIIRALKAYKEGRLGLLVRPVTPSVNREMEKQNDILLQQTAERIQNGDLQMMQALMGQGTPPELKSYIADVIFGKNILWKQILMAFNKRDVDIMAPLPNIVKEIRDAAAQQKNSARSYSGAAQAPTQAQGVLPGGGGAGATQLPSSISGPVSGNPQVPQTADSGASIQ